MHPRDSRRPAPARPREPTWCGAFRTGRESGTWPETSRPSSARTVYGVLGVVVAVGPWVLAVAFGKDVVHYAGLFVGPVLFVGSFFVKAHAARMTRGEELKSPADL